jgi:hypothetical protein
MAANCIRPTVPGAPKSDSVTATVRTRPAIPFAARNGWPACLRTEHVRFRHRPKATPRFHHKCRGGGTPPTANRGGFRPGLLSDGNDLFQPDLSEDEI